jgi:hypothetical protein
MTHPMRENLELSDLEGTNWICCSNCRFRYCYSDQNWREFCKVRLLPPAKAGSLLTVLDGQYLLRQLYCPSCAALVDTDFVENRDDAIRDSSSS